MSNQNEVQEPVAVAEETKQKSGSFDWLLPTIAAVVIVKLFGIAGGLVSFGCYYWLAPKLGKWGAVAIAAVAGAVAAVALMALIR